ncbi:radical SAM protein [Streptomyces triticirhizae]|uniref:Radical SAM protein n=1 Tax=Streptomyces triticirhizae TaxID=2483353 RepID=A0A3M2MDJ4_9ACTN|nr:radical SAM protein [Streptomyces triticirhizae]RMI46715.1 radical SAM protein [Streptomyces triticirhizae]
MPRDITLLWAVRSPCSFGCPHCYFGELEEHKETLPEGPGVLSHIPVRDLDRAVRKEFARTLAGSPVERVVLAGGEPLDWLPTLSLIKTIKDAGCEVVVATNGVPLIRPGIARRLVELGVDGVSVSLDSADATVNDRLRPSRSGRVGHREVLAGIRTLLRERGSEPGPRVGVYTVVMRDRPQEITDVARLASDIGVDYYVPQPISLPPDHKLFAERCHTSGDVPAVKDQLRRLQAEPRGLSLPDPAYMRQFLVSISTQGSGRVADCFGGARLFFIQPDGSLWDCPSDRRIAATSASARRTIVGGDARTLFADRPACTDCSHFSRDCVNMGPLVLDMPRLLGREAP